MMIHRGHKLTTAMTVLCASIMLPVIGCVLQSTYDAALKEEQATKLELARALEEQKVLARQVTDMELSNADSVREAEAAAAALQEAKDDAEYERQQFDQQLAKLKQKVAQATKQQRSLQYELTVAKENTTALQEVIDGHQRKVRDGAAAAMPDTVAEPAVHKPFDPSTIPLPQDLPATPAVAQQQPVTTPAPAPAPLPTRARPPQPPPPDDDWFTSIKNWLMSLWRSVFS